VLQARGTPISKPLKAADQTVIEEDKASAAEQRPALFLNTHGHWLGRTHSNPVSLFDGFVEQPDPAFYFLPVEPDYLPAKKLIEVILNQVLVGLTDFDAEFHIIFLMGPPKSGGPGILVLL
jgi:hypothetical protein